LIFERRVDLLNNILIYDKDKHENSDCSQPGNDKYPTNQQINIFETSHNSIMININSSEKGWLLLADVWYPGWKATIDGRETKIFRADYLFRGIEVPEGNHSIKFQYQPISFIIGGTISAVSLGILILYVCVYLRRQVSIE
jgi:uncharacterized membrane protein YfhO